MEHNNSNTSEYKEKVVHLGKVTKVVKGGRNFRWSALVVVGNENGRVGVGLGKAAEVTEAIRKGVEDAKKNIKMCIRDRIQSRSSIRSTAKRKRKSIRMQSKISDSFSKAGGQENGYQKV